MHVLWNFIKYFLVIIFAMILFVYVIVWIMSFRTYPVEYGLTYNYRHAEYLGLDWRATYEEMLRDLRPKYLRLTVAWNDIEKEPGKFDYADMDFLMDRARDYGAKVTLVVGQKAPRWPECHVPEWANSLANTDYRKSLSLYVKNTVERYSKHSALEIWQVENEPYIKFKFGACLGFDEEIVAEEIALVKNLDPKHEIIVTDSGELSDWREAASAADKFGVTLYRRVRTPNNYIWNYSWIPAGWYTLHAFLVGRNPADMYIMELQAEPWFSDASVMDTPLAIQYRTMSLKYFEKNLDYVTHIGTPRAYLWGVEWWYWMRDKQNVTGFLDMAREALRK
ncbi:MAG TPA: beta-galactosidase [Candidatus Magasanikbacteria bacterium]|nr:beta-galactosidase [Candidatus Magasanikbacteria bacterium]